MADDSSKPTPSAPRFGARMSALLADHVADFGQLAIDATTALGGVSLFGFRTLSWLTTRMPRRETLLPNFYQVGVLSLPVVALTGTFIGMVLAVQSYVQFRTMHLETRLGAVINMTLVRELGPVLAATMLAGRVGSAMAAELGTMRVTEQIDALASMGANPIHYLAVPRFLACLILIPSLTIMADFMGVAGAYFYSVHILNIDMHHYFANSEEYVGTFDIFSGVFKSLFFGAAIALVSCHRGFHCDPGAEGVGRAATTAFVYSFVLILILDLGLGIGLEGVYDALWPETGHGL
jgi:phospholipid/cholesterol/gamma-HCH transport system permease protein